MDNIVLFEESDLQRHDEAVYLSNFNFKIIVVSSRRVYVNLQNM